MPIKIIFFSNFLCLFIFAIICVPQTVSYQDSPLVGFSRIDFMVGASNQPSAKTFTYNRESGQLLEFPA